MQSTGRTTRTAAPRRRAWVRRAWVRRARAWMLAAGVAGVAGVAAGCNERGGETPASGGPAGGLPTYAVEVVNRYPHDADAFTQGLVFHDGVIYEGTGLEGRSSVRRVDLASGAVVKSVPLANEYFGEGIAVLGDRLYQLTWKHGLAFVYDAATLAVRDTLRYTGEGWGLATDGTSLILSDGTSRLRFLDPATFDVRRTVTVTDQGLEVQRLNELEMVDGELLANVWETPQIARIDPATGKITGWIDATPLVAELGRPQDGGVLNGIAYDAAGRRLFITGKLWAQLVEVTLRRQ